MKKLLLGLVALVGFGFMIGGSDTPASPAPVQQSLVNEAPAQTVQVIKVEEKVLGETAEPAVVDKKKPEENVTPKKEEPEPAVKSSASCGEDYYRNVNGNCIHRPVAAPSTPSGASAQCKDGTYSFSQNRRGTCSGHGGVASWL